MSEVKPALSIVIYCFLSHGRLGGTFRVQEGIDPVTDAVQVIVGGVRRWVVDRFALLRSSSLEARQTTANVCRYTLTFGSCTVHLPHLAFLVAWGARRDRGKLNYRKISLWGGRFGRLVPCLRRAEQDFRGIRRNGGC